MFDLPQLDLKNKVSEQEWQLRVDLAACYRLVDHFRWGDLIYFLADIGLTSFNSK